MLSNTQKMHLKLFQKEQFKKQQKQLVTLFVIKLLIKLQRPQKVHHRIIHKQLQMSMIIEYI